MLNRDELYQRYQWYNEDEERSFDDFVADYHDMKYHEMREEELI